MFQADLFDSSPPSGSGAFPSNQRGAWLRWAEFKPLLARYGAERNRVVPCHPFVSRLSPALRTRLILESELVEAALEKLSFSTVEKFVQEVLWRSYWKAWLENRPEVWISFREELKVRQETLSDASIKRVQEVLEGRSGIAVIDKFTQELVQTGYMHNHARMWWASYWIHVEKLPWVLGADFFYRHLLDGDPASNTLSWRWVAGLQTPGKSYLIRRSNLEKYCAPEYLDDKAGLDRLADGLVEPAIPETWPTRSASQTLGDVFLPSCSSPVTRGDARWGWWLHGEDLHVQSTKVLLPSNQPVGVAAFVSQGLCERFKLSQPRVKYMENALQDGLKRATALYKLQPGEVSQLPSGISLAEAITEWAVQTGLEEVWAFRPFVGPLRDELPQIEHKLTSSGKKLCLIVRAWDTELLPIAKGGYFRFWEHTKKRFEHMPR